MSAERSRRAMVTEADGTRQAQILRAEGFALSLENIFRVAHTVDQKTMGLQYLEALKVIGASPSSKFIVPLEFTSLIQPFVKALPQGVGEKGENKAA